MSNPMKNWLRVFILIGVVTTIPIWALGYFLWKLATDSPEGPAWPKTKARFEKRNWLLQSVGGWWVFFVVAFSPVWSIPFLFYVMWNSCDRPTGIHMAKRLGSSIWSLSDIL